MVSMTAFTDELVKIASVIDAGKKAIPLIKNYGKPAALIGGGAVGYHLGKKELEKYQLGRRMYAQMEAQGGM